MKIPNPWPNQPHIRFNVNNGECTGSCSAGPEIEVPDTAVEVLIEPCARGRYNSETLAPGHVWSKEFGMLDAEDHWKKVKILKEEDDLKMRQGAELRRRQDEARAAEAKAKDAEPEERIDVARAACGLVKVTKALKSKK